MKPSSVPQYCLFADAGDLTFMVGGHPRAAEAVTPLLKQMGKSVIYCGKHGAGGLVLGAVELLCFRRAGRLHCSLIIIDRLDNSLHACR